MRRLGVVGVVLALQLWRAVAAGAADPCDVSISFVDFGRIDPRRGGTITGEVAVRCPAPTRFVLALSPGHGDYRMRRMRGPGGTELKYNIFVDPARRQIWGDGTTGGTARIVGQSDGRKATLITVYGRVPPGQSGGRAGAYSDALTVTLER